MARQQGYALFARSLSSLLGQGVSLSTTLCAPSSHPSIHTVWYPVRSTGSSTVCTANFAATSRAPAVPALVPDRHAPVPYALWQLPFSPLFVSDRSHCTIKTTHLSASVSLRLCFPLLPGLHSRARHCAHPYLCPNQAACLMGLQQLQRQSQRNRPAIHRASTYSHCCTVVHLQSSLAALVGVSDLNNGTDLEIQCLLLTLFCGGMESLKPQAIRSSSHAPSTLPLLPLSTALLPSSSPTP